MLVARFSDNIDSDIKRGWSTYMLPGLGGTYADCERDIEEFNCSGCEIREFPEYPGCFGVVHHEGLSCYYLDAETIEDAIEEVKSDKGMDGSGFGYMTIGTATLLKTIPANEIGTERDLHILEVEDVEKEEY